MGQSDVLEVLKKSKRWLFVAEIMRTGFTRSAVNRALKVLLKLKEVEKREVIVKRRAVYQWQSI